MEETAITDEIMMEVHAIKDAIGEKYGNDLKALFEEIKRGEAKLKAAGVGFVAPPAEPKDPPRSALQRIRFARDRGVGLVRPPGKAVAD